MIGNTPVVSTKPFITKNVKGSQKVDGGGNDIIVKNLVNRFESKDLE